MRQMYFVTKDNIAMFSITDESCTNIATFDVVIIESIDGNRRYVCISDDEKIYTSSIINTYNFTVTMELGEIEGIGNVTVDIDCDDNLKTIVITY